MLFTISLFGLVLAALVLRVLAALVAARARRRQAAAWVDFPTDDEVAAAIKSVPGHFASAVTSQKVGSRFSVGIFPHVPGTTSAAYLTPDSGTTHEWVDMAEYEWFAVAAANAVLTGNGLTLLEIWAADDNAGTNATLIISSGALTGTTVPKGGFVECTASQIKEISAANSFKLRYVTAKITVANAADVLAVTQIRGMAKHPSKDLTPATF